jgi:hypothetical protein
VCVHVQTHTQLCSYYNDIRRLPPLSDQEMYAHLAEESRAHAGQFYVYSALNELYKYVDQYKVGCTRKRTRAVTGAIGSMFGRGRVLRAKSTAGQVCQHARHDAIVRRTRHIHMSAQTGCIHISLIRAGIP